MFFKENVGRQGQFPHGIDILTKCDYYAVGQLQNCYLNLSVYIAQFEAYRQILIDHLLDQKFNHWDLPIRELTSQSLHELTKCCPDYMAFEVFPKLIKQTNTIDLNTRHGALHSIANLIHALCKIDDSNEDKQTLKRYFFEDLLKDFKSLVMDRLFDEKYFRGSTGENMIIVVCFFIKKCVESNFFVHFPSLCFSDNQKFLTECEQFLTQTIEYNKDNVQQSAVDALYYFSDLKFKNKPAEFTEKLNKMFKNQRQTSKEYIRSGYCLAMGNFPKHLFDSSKSDQNLVNIIKCLIESSKSISVSIGNSIQVNSADSNQTSGWVKARQDSIRSLQNLFENLCVIENDQQQAFEWILKDRTLCMELFDAYFHGMNDYSFDSRGDSGSKVREASIEALESIMSLCGRFKVDFVLQNRDLIVRVFSNIIQQAVERIDRTRSLAGRAFFNLLHNYAHLNLDHFDFVQKLKQVFSKEICDEIDWNLAHVTLPLFIKFLQYEEFQLELLSGFMYSIGSLTESLVKPAEQFLLKELKQIEKEQPEVFNCIINNIFNLCKQILAQEQTTNSTKSTTNEFRLSLSLIKSMDIILQNGLQIPNLKEFLVVFLNNVKLTRDMTKLISYIDLFCDILLVELNKNSKDFFVKEKCMFQLMLLICHPYPRIRKSTSTKLFELLINLSDFSSLFQYENDYNECISLLTESEWDQPIELVRPMRNRICDLTNTPKPVVVAKKTSQAK